MSRSGFYYFAIIVATTLLLANCHDKKEPVDPPGPSLPAGTTFLEPSAQRSGNPDAGLNSLLYGDFISSGVPYDVFTRIFGNSNPDDLGRTGDSKGIPYRYNVATASNGQRIVAPTCLGCHTEMLNGVRIIGLGNNTSDNTSDQSTLFNGAELYIKLFYGEGSKEWAAFYPASRAYKAVSPYIITKVRGVNPADKIFASLAAHRKQDDLKWLDNPQFSKPLEVVPTDVPALWLLKKKNALYYNGLGRGDFARLSSASGMLTMLDSAEARHIDRQMVDIMAWFRTLEAPVYPHTTDPALVAQGKTIFESHCAKCHGTYGGTSETYPNLLVDLPTIGTDPALANTYKTYPEYHSWYNNSWYAKDAAKTQLLPNEGYIAPPLDGIWATAPYLHNGSVPTLEDLLNSKQRPTYWSRNFDNGNADYNTEKVGWNYTVESSKVNTNTYDTTLPAYTNVGHTFGDVLTAEQRKALIEYLKTL